MLGVIVLSIFIFLSIESQIQKLTGHSLRGFPEVIILVLFIGSIIMISLGIIGYYVARIYEEIKGRPRYIIDQYLG